MLALLVGGPFLYLRRRREQGRETVRLYYDDGSSVTLEQGAPDAERLLELARAAL